MNNNDADNWFSLSPAKNKKNRMVVCKCQANCDAAIYRSCWK